MKTPSWALLAGVATLGAAIAIVSTKERTVSANIQVRPFVAEFWGVDFSKQPEGAVVSRNSVGMKADGSKATFWVEEGAAGSRRRIDSIDGRSEGIWEGIQAKMTSYFRPREIAARKALLLTPPADCVLGPQERIVRTEQIFGEDLSVVESTIAQGTRRITQWRLRSNGCVMLQSMWEDRQPGGAYRKTFENRLVFLARTEPDARLFASGDGYREMPPSQARNEYLAKAGVTPEACPSCFSQDIADKDAEYYRRLAR